MKNKLWICSVRYGAYFIGGLILSYILASIIVEGNSIIGDAIDKMLSVKQVEFNEFIIRLLILTVIGFVVAFFKSITTSMFLLKVLTSYKNLLAKKLYHLNYRYFDVNGTASVINKVNSDVTEIATLLNQNIPEICTNLVAMITYAVYVGNINIGLLLLIGICYPFLLYVNSVDC